MRRSHFIVALSAIALLTGCHKVSDDEEEHEHVEAKSQDLGPKAPINAKYTYMGYFYDDRTELCFASPPGASAWVSAPCTEEVKRLAAETPRW